MPHKYFVNARSILCLNGDLPDANFFAQNKIIIATDGAVDKLLKMGIKPSIVIGDLDSIGSGDYRGIEIIHFPDQHTSDFQKAMNYLGQNNLLPTVVCGVNGGLLDHILYNINVSLEHDSIFYAPPLIGYPLKSPNILNLNLKINTKISLFGMSKARVTTRGLKWELYKDNLEFPGFNSCSNRTNSENISIEVIEGKLLVLIHLETIKDEGTK